LNNVEAVFINHPDLGVWTVTISPFAIPQPSQGYALVITGQVQDCKDTDNDGIPDHVEEENGWIRMIRKTQVKISMAMA